MQGPSSPARSPESAMLPAVSLNDTQSWAAPPLALGGEVMEGTVFSPGVVEVVLVVPDTVGVATGSARKRQVWEVVPTVMAAEEVSKYRCNPPVLVPFRTNTARSQNWGIV